MPPDLTRRGLIAGSGALLATPAVVRPAFSQTGRRVIIMGAGIAGLAAARALADGGFKVEIIEARNRIGGRIHTLRDLGAPVELGAGWIHGLRGNPITALANKAKARTFVTDDDTTVVMRPGGRLVSDRETDAAERRYRRLLDNIDDTLEETDDTSLKSAIEKRDAGFLETPLNVWALSSDAEDDMGEDATRVSAYWFDEDDGFEGDDAILPDGYDRLLPQLAEGLPIHFDAAISHIEYGPGRVAVRASTKTFEADHAICTLPLGVLKAGTISFNPPLPSALRDSIGTIGFGAVIKVAIAFEENLWPAAPHWFGYVSPAKGQWPLFLNGKAYSGKNILTAVAAGDFARAAAAMTDDELRTDILAAASDMFGKALPRPSGFVASRWSQDPFTQGAYSVIPPGATPAHFDRFRTPGTGALHFAGEHTGFQHHATVHGAYLSGLRAARAIIGQRP